MGTKQTPGSRNLTEPVMEHNTDAKASEQKFQTTTENQTNTIEIIDSTNSNNN